MIDCAEYLKVTAMMLSGDPKNFHNINAKLVSHLDNINKMCTTCGGHLISRQVIALAIGSWQVANPNEHAYVEM